MKTAKVRLISIIGYSSVFDDNEIQLHVWGELFDSKEKAIKKVEQISGLTAEQKKILKDQGCITTGDSLSTQHYFILYPDEQKRWVKTLVKELL